MSDRDVVIRVENISKLYRLGEVGTGSFLVSLEPIFKKLSELFF